jgi:hypothetical protein
MYKSSFAALAAAVAAVFAVACDQGATSPDALAPLLDATAAPTRTSFDGYIYFCSDGQPPDREWFAPGGTLHFRNAGNTNQWDMGNPLIDGIETNEVDLNLNFNGGVGFVHGTSPLVPFAVSGTWQIKFHVNTSNGTARGVGHGTGNLQGMSLKFSNVVSTATTPPNPCNTAPDRAWTTGIITTPRGP